MMQPFRTCLYCSSEADSREHWLQSALGGQLDPMILCGFHNREVDRLCDQPLIKQLAFFVHHLSVVKGRGDDGLPVTATMAEGETYNVGRDRIARVPRKILERDAARKPTVSQHPSVDDVKRFLSTTGQALGSPGISLRVTQPADGENLTLLHAMQIGGESGFRGVLKIAYEYVRGHLLGSVVDAHDDAALQRALLCSNDPTSFVRWLPYQMVPPPTVDYYCHRLFAWQHEESVLVIVELFSTVPFVVELPGLHLETASYFTQGVRGEAHISGEFVAPPAWSFADVPEHAQQSMLEEFHRRAEAIGQQSRWHALAMLMVDAIFDAIESHRDAPPAVIAAEAMRRIEEEIIVTHLDRQMLTMVFSGLAQTFVASRERTAPRD
jgi:hypothetical protein